MDKLIKEHVKMIVKDLKQAEKNHPDLKPVLEVAIKDVREKGFKLQPAGKK
ncbi:MAG: hypothetical protein RBG13Loki_4249 [Promethearchaeota archaeon CR_4]|nr:MAG: hypothetical protein RBG13Loki_4249 [Candidatus Lokiarchaeota archaeon CR_4]